MGEEGRKCASRVDDQWSCGEWNTVIAQEQQVELSRKHRTDDRLALDT